MLPANLQRILKSPLLYALIIGVLFRLFHIEFGLPHVTFADEDKLGNPAIVFSYSAKKIIANKDFSQLAPEDFVYGTFSVYLNFIVILGLKIILKLFGSDIGFMNGYIAMRVFQVFISLLLIPIIFYLYKTLFSGVTSSIIAAFLIAINWKLVVHSHYLNSDIILSVLFIASLAALFFSTMDKKLNLKLLSLSGMLFGLTVGTKITALISLPFILLYVLHKAGLGKVFLYLLMVALAYMLSNPFSLIYKDRFITRINEMRIKENGIVFDSVDFSRSKYLYSLSSMLTLPVFIFSILGIFLILDSKTKYSKFHLLLIANILIYFLFFTFSSRKVDRWLLPIVPILILYASYALLIVSKTLTLNLKTHHLSYLLIFLVLTYYSYPSVSLLWQFKRYTPQVEAFLWEKQNIRTQTPKLLITDSALDPQREIPGIKIVKVGVYSSKSAQLQIPEDPRLFEYIIAVSRPLTRYQNPPIRLLFPNYYETWKAFDEEIRNSSDFILVKEFPRPEPNLIPFSSVFIYKNLRYVPVPTTQGTLPIQKDEQIY